MAGLKESLLSLDHGDAISKEELSGLIREDITQAGYTIVEEDIQKPWGGYIRFDNDDAERFVSEFFPGLDIQEARLGNPDAPLSPKILIVSPEQRLSWQYHDRRAERWAFLTAGGYFKSTTDDPGELVTVDGGEVVQFGQSERHRLVGDAYNYTLVAEIWQHTEPEHLSNEEDIVRLQDDYKRESMV